MGLARGSLPLWKSLLRSGRMVYPSGRIAATSGEMRDWEKSGGSLSSSDDDDVPFTAAGVCI